VVIGYNGFSFAIRRRGNDIIVGESVTHADLIDRLQNHTHPPVTFYGVDNNSALIQAWLKSDKTHSTQLRQWLDAQDHKDDGITNVVSGKEFGDLRAQIVQQFNIK
jgi:hypothetical protein